MIVNVPSSEDLLDTSLRLYFKAWSETTTIVTEWLEYSGEPAGDEWRDYLQGAQSDLQGIYTLIQQSQEIGLKALIADVSPFLLLKKHEASPLEKSGTKFDFTDFATHDAANLIRIHDTFCKRTISKPFVVQYDEIRRARNKISHLGIFGDSLDPMAIIDLLVIQYLEVYPDRSWMEDRLEFAALHRWSDWVDGDDYGWNDRTGLLNELWRLLPLMSDATFQSLMKHPRTERRYICVHCTVDGKLGDREPYDNDIPTAYRMSDGTRVWCVICESAYKCEEVGCPEDGCDGDLLSAEAESAGQCLTCGRGGPEFTSD